MIGFGHYLGLACVVFGLGAIGFLIRRNILIQMMCIELMLNAVNIALVAINRWRPFASDGSLDHSGQAFAFFVIAVAAAEAAVGLAIVLGLFRLRQTVLSDDVRALRH